MTAKVSNEKLCEGCGEAGLGCNQFGCWKTGLVYSQNAAESLPAAPEHPRADCEGCNKPDCPCNSGEGDEGWAGMFSSNPSEPVAPVEAKEKNRLTYEETKQRFGLPVAEPELKPCPFCGVSPRGADKDKVRHCQMHGDPSQEMIVRCVNPACRAKPSVSAGDVYDGGEPKARSEAIAAWNTRLTQPQPDSSSIPDHIVDANKLVDSSSISTEQTFEEWLAMDYPDIAKRSNNTFRSAAKAMKATWNAAKGQSNGR